MWLCFKKSLQFYLKVNVSILFFGINIYNPYLSFIAILRIDSTIQFYCNLKQFIKFYLVFFCSTKIYEVQIHLRMEDLNTNI